MFNPFKSAPKTGSDLISDAIGEFESFAARIEAGVQQNRESISANNEAIACLQADNKFLDGYSGRGESVAAKLRDLIA